MKPTKVWIGVISILPITLLSLAALLLGITLWLVTLGHFTILARVAMTPYEYICSEFFGFED